MTDDELKAQFEFLVQVRDKITEVHDAVLDVREIRAQVQQWVSRTEGVPGGGSLAGAAKELETDLDRIEDALIQWRAQAFEDTFHYPIRLNNQLATVADLTNMAAAAPTAKRPTSFVKQAGLLGGLVALAILVLLPQPDGLSVAGQRMLGIFAFAVIVWMSEAVDYAASSIILMALIAFLLGTVRTIDVIAGPGGARVLSLRGSTLRAATASGSPAATTLLFNLCRLLAERVAARTVS